MTRVRHYTVLLLALPLLPSLVLAQPAAWVNARTSGAKGDGRADDTATLQGDISTAPPGSVIFIPAGVYSVSTPLRLKSQLTIIGAGAATILRLCGESPAVMLGEDVRDVRIADMAVEGGKLDPVAEENGGIVIHITKGSGDIPLHLSIERVSFSAFRSSGIAVTATGQAVATDVTVRDCSFGDLGMHGVLGYFCRRYCVEHCRFAGMGRAGTIFPRCWDVTVRDCSVRTTGWHGIEVGDETEGFLIEGNVIEDSGDHAGILAEQAAHCGVIRDNRIRSPRFGGIQLNNKPAKAAVKQITVSGNFIDMGANRSRSGIHIYGDTTYTVDDCIIEGNTIYGGLAGIEAHYLKRCRFDRNLIRGPQRGLDLVHLNTVAVTDNIVTDCANEGIRITPYAEVFKNAQVRVLDNVFSALGEGVKSPGIFIEALTSGLLRGNTITGFAEPVAVVNSAEVRIER